MREKPHALCIGAGAVGRGLLAPKLIDAGYMVTFCDTDFSIVKRINSMRYYPLVGRGIFKWIGPVTAMQSRDIEKWITATNDTAFDYDYIFVSVKANNLPDVAPIVDYIIDHSERNPLVYIVENYNNASEKFGNMLKADGAIVADSIANVIVPLSPHQNQDPTFTVYDPNMELVLEKVKGAPLISTARYVNREEFEFEWALKFWLHCSVHAFVGFWGIRHGFEYVHEVITSSPHDIVVSDFMKMIADAILIDYPMMENEIRKRMQSEFKAMADSLMLDDLYRVSRDIDRKLDPDERLIGLMQLLLKVKDVDIREIRSYMRLVDVVNDAIAKAKLTPETITQLPSWNDIDLSEYRDVLEDLEYEWEKRFSNSSDC